MITKTIPISVTIIKSFQCKIALPFVFELKEKSIETKTTRTLLSNYSQNWCRGVVVITTVQLHSTKSELQVRHKFKYCSQHDGYSRWWGSLTMVLAGNKTKRLSSVNHTTKRTQLKYHNYNVESFARNTFWNLFI